LLAAAEGSSMNASIVLALLIGARTEELRALTWDRLDLDGDPPTIDSSLALRSSSGVTIEEIAHLVGHGSASVTERVYRKELRPVITRGARAINELFDGDAKR
jgi:integrase